MSLNLVKLCVGIDSPKELEEAISRRIRLAEASGKAFEQIHTTRMTPKRGAELLDGGSLYWVIKGAVQCRQRLLDLREVKGDDGIARCQIVLEPVLHLTERYPKRPFQGWRYLEIADTPRDLRGGDMPEELPEALRSELKELGLL